MVIQLVVPYIITNRIGFTTEPVDGRSTTYSTDIAKGYDVPILHVNADDVEATIEAIDIAMEFRKEFHKDFVIDLVGYRRYGHNEMDEPSITNPLPYHNIRKHDSVEIIYGNKLVEDGVISKEQMEDVMDKVQKKCVLLKTKLINQIKWIIQIWKDLSHCKNLYKVMIRISQ